MKMFVFKRIEQVSSNLHPEGGLMVVARDKDHVEYLLEVEKYIELSDGDWEKVIIFELKNDEEPRVIIFPDAGCC